jgi:DMSO/TMAO reductase YedYZ molybdopterin-dependent catalytic subunit
VNNVKLEPRGFFRRIPLAPHQLLQRLTRIEDAIVLCHLGVPRLERNEWSLEIDGLVTHSLSLSFDDLARYPRVSVASVHQCAGSPLEPFEPTRRVCNITWSGARLADILADCGPGSRARYIWSYGADYGEFSGVEVDAYLKDLPIDRVGPDVLVAYEMNGKALSWEHGFPARLVIPGFYGTNSVKWLTRMTLAPSRATGPFTTRWYNDPMLDSTGHETGQTKPVWSIAPESLIVAPAPHETIDLGIKREIWGWAWADGGVRLVHVSTDGGVTWQVALLEPARGHEWQCFSIPWMPDCSGRVVLAARAESIDGVQQPITGRRNAVYQVPVSVS